MSASTDLTFALYHAIAYLTRSLIGRYSATTIDLLHFTLERNLAKQYENNWFPNDPQRGSGRRCLTLSPTGVPPRPIYYACKSARVNWEDWMICLGGVEMDLFVDPGCVSVRFGKCGAGVASKLCIVWSAKAGVKSAEVAPSQNQTIAQSIIDDDEEDELFNMIADEIRAPTWMTPILNQFPTVPRPTVTIATPTITTLADKEPVSSTSTCSTSSLLSVATRHSRSSSHSSDSSSSGFSFSSVESAESAATSILSRISPAGSPHSSKSVLLPAATLIMQAPVSFDDEDEYDECSTPVATPNGKISRRERVRQARVHIDVNKKEVTPYDGGKTTVLTGGVMLGMKATTNTTIAVTPSTPRFLAPPSTRKPTWRNIVTNHVTSPRVRA